MMKEKNALTMLTITTGFILIYIIFEWKVVLFLSFTIGLIGIFSPYLSSKVCWFWLKLGDVLGLVVPKIVLGVIFFGLLFPIALVARIFQKDPLMLSRDHPSFFIDHSIFPDKSYFEKSW